MNPFRLDLDRQVGHTLFCITIEGAYAYFPAEGDNWHSPYIPESLEIDACVIAVERYDSRGWVAIRYLEGFIGPMEFGAPVPGVTCFDDLLEEEKARIEEYTWDLHHERQRG